MRDAMCFLLTMILFFSCLYAGGAPEALPPARQSAWWGLLFPGLFARPGGGDGDGVTFVWPLLREVWGFFRRNG